MKNTIPYRKTYILQTPLTQITCRNFSNGVKLDLPRGTRVELCHPSGPTSTDVRLMNVDGECIAHPDNLQAYHFSVDNQELGRALGLEFPTVTPDLVGDLMAHESGELDAEQEKATLHRLLESGVCEKLQGHYSRTVTERGPHTPII